VQACSQSILLSSAINCYSILLCVEAFRYIGYTSHVHFFLLLEPELFSPGPTYAILKSACISEFWLKISGEALAAGPDLV